MKKITEDAIRAFRNGDDFKQGNTEVYTWADSTLNMKGSVLLLHGHTIATLDADGLFITLAGWASKTTKERLNGLPNVHIVQKKTEWFLNGKLWDGSLIKVE
jgi:hypothetical protein